MTQNPSASDWAASRGEKWLAQLAGMEAMMTPVDEPLFRALHINAPCRIADIGCGGGGTTLEIRRRAPPGSVVHGFDISPALIESARARKGSESSVAFEVADMATAKPPEGPYDRLVSRFGIMFFDDPAAAFSNIARWLAPGGRFAFAAWGHLAENPWMTTIRDVVAEIIELPPPKPDAPGPFRYGDPDRLVAVLRGAGFGELDVVDWRSALPIGGGLPPEKVARFALASFSSFGEMLAAAGDKAVEEARRLLTERFSGHQKAGTVRMEACVHIFTGVRG